MAYTPITNLPTPPSRQEPATFSVQADAFLGALPTFGTQVNAAGDFIDGVGAQVTTDAATASAAAATAVNAANADEWVSGATYAEGDVVWSGITYQTYRSKAAHSGITTDPAGDAVNWQVISSAAAAPSGPTLQAIASGSLTDGSTVIVNADGTVSVVSGVAQELGTSSVFGGIPFYLVATFDSLNNKVVLAYRDSNIGTAVVGTVSGTSISFGTPVVFETGSADHIAITFDSSNNKIVIAYQDLNNSSFGTAVVGTVSGTSISFGTPVVFRSASTQLITAVFDTLNNKVVISFAEPSVGKAIVGTVSGTSISFGAIATFEAANNVTYLATTFDNINNKVVQAYRGGGVNSAYGTAVVGTVSGTSISFGASATFEAGSVLFLTATFDSINGKVIVAYRNAGNSNFGTAVVGTVSGTVITFGIPVVFFEAITTNPFLNFDPDTGKVILVFRDDVDTGVIKVGTVGGISNNSISFVGSLSFTTNAGLVVSTYDSFNDKSVIAYRDNANSGFGTASVFNTGSTNLTEGNFLGFSDGAYSDTQTATIQLVGSIDDAQSGLTAGQKYYVQLTGGLGTTPADPEVYAGIAVAADKIIVKG
jgi:hypothetical protein